jgi:uncharacterized protein (TIGR02145 family)
MKNKNLIILSIIFVTTLLMACNSGEKTLKTVKIGDQIWMVENLNVTTFRNGDSIPEAKTDEAWAAADMKKSPAWCYYNNDPLNGTKYGKLYNGYAITDPRGLAPAGWHEPTDIEWQTLGNFLKGTELDSGTKLKSTSGWAENGNGTNVSGFTAVPGGMRYSNGPFSDNVGKNGYWWTCTTNKDFETLAYHRYMIYDSPYVHGDNTLDNRVGEGKGMGFSVRCIKNL